MIQRGDDPRSWRPASCSLTFWACASAATSSCANSVLDDPAPFVPFFLTKTQKGDRLRGQGGDARRAALHRLPQPRPDEEADAAARACDPGRARTGVEAGGQGAGRQQGLSPVPLDEARWTTAISPSTRPRRRRTPSSTASSCSRTNARLSPLEAMLVYKQLWTVDIDPTLALSRIKGWRVLG